MRGMVDLRVLLSQRGSSDTLQKYSVNMIVDDGDEELHVLLSTPVLNVGLNLV